MSSAFSRKAIVASMAVAFLVVAMGFFGSLYWKGGTPGTVQDRVAVEQSRANPASADAVHNNSAVSQRKTKEEKEKPSIGVCRETWIGERNTPTYDCNVLFGPV